MMDAMTQSLYLAGVLHACMTCKLSVKTRAYGMIGNAAVRQPRAYPSIQHCYDTHRLAVLICADRRADREACLGKAP